jgi:hypothetical protein
MSVGTALQRALSDFYQQSWRLLLLNSALSGFVLSVLVTGFWFEPALVLLVLAGPLAAALMHCAITLMQTGELSLGDAVTGARLHWRRGLVLGLAVLVVGVAAGFAVPFYAGMGGWAWPLALAALYLAVLFGVVQLLLWPLAVFEFQRPLAEVARDSLGRFVRRPVAGLALAVALLAVNLVGLAAAFIPFLTLTVAYSFLTAAHFVLPRPDPGGSTAWPA